MLNVLGLVLWVVFFSAIACAILTAMSRRVRKGKKKFLPMFLRSTMWTSIGLLLGILFIAGLVGTFVFIDNFSNTLKGYPE